MKAPQDENNTDPFELGPYESLGMMAWLMSHADYHSRWPLWSFKDDILPPLLNSQYRIYLDEHNNPVGFVTWAWLNQTGKQKALMQSGCLALKDWNAGEHLMINDFVAPWGHARQMATDLRRGLFTKARGFALRRNPDGSVRKMMIGQGREAVTN